MVAFFLTGGLGDAILGMSVVKELSAIYGPLLALNFNPLTRQVIEGQPGVAATKQLPADQCRSMANIAAACPDVEMVVFNKFRRDHKGLMNFFCPLSKPMCAEAESRRIRYMEELARQTGVKAGRLEDIDTYRLLKYFNSEDNYFADWNRYGIPAGYEGVVLQPVPGKPSPRTSFFSKLGRYAVVHDSKFPGLDGKSNYITKAWYGPRWSQVCRRLTSDLGMDSVVQMCSKEQPMFDQIAVRSEDVFGARADFWDYLELVRQAALYVGTDSWPGHAAVFLKGTAFVLLKGAVSRRWDHGCRYATIIRKGSCQACEGPAMSVSRCIWANGAHTCMDSITADDVIVAAGAELEKVKACNSTT